jgi:hypothetical protein
MKRSPPWDELSGEERIVLRRLGPFAVTLDELSPLSTVDVEPVLELLCEKSWVLRTQGSAFLRLRPLPGPKRS